MWSSDNMRLTSSSSDTTVQVENVAKGQHCFTYRGYAKVVNFVA
jgi:hypothetical protein